MLLDRIMEIIRSYGDLGVFVAMFLESSIIPIPSEVVVVGAGAIGVSISSIVIFGSIGATLGSLVGYAIGRYAALPVVLKLGKYIFITKENIEKAERFAKKYGASSVLIGRLLPVIPFKVFSIAAGITRLPLSAFIIYTMIGIVPRMLLLSIFGYSLLKYTKITLLIAAILGVIAVLVYMIVKHMKNQSKSGLVKAEEVKSEHT
jgi:membrane protein DedA with SNARE-associated domain